MSHGVIQIVSMAIGEPAVIGGAVVKVTLQIGQALVQQSLVAK